MSSNLTINPICSPPASATAADPPMRVLIQTACYLIPDGVTSTIRKLEAYILTRAHPCAEVCILTTRSGNPGNEDKWLDLIDASLRDGARLRRTIIYATALPLPVMEIYAYQIGLELGSGDLAKVSMINETHRTSVF